jgi:hypothetical protein
VHGKGRFASAALLVSYDDDVRRRFRARGWNDRSAHYPVLPSREGTPIDLFVEGPKPTWALPLPDPIDPAPRSAPGALRFIFDLDGLPPGTSADGAMLTFTAVSPNDAIEVNASLN